MLGSKMGITTAESRSYYDCPFPSYNWLTEGEGGGTVQLAKDRSARRENAVALIRLLRGYDSNLQKEWNQVRNSSGFSVDGIRSRLYMQFGQNKNSRRVVAIGNLVPKTEEQQLVIQFLKLIPCRRIVCKTHSTIILKHCNTTELELRNSIANAQDFLIRIH